jgi:UDP-glucose 4-epimerase
VDISFRITRRRAGDPAVLVAGSKLAREKLGWEPEYSDIETILETAWKWLKAHPHGCGYR